MQTVRSFCRVCTSVCGILVDVEGDEVIRVRGDQDHPFSRGYTCAKGRALPLMHHHPDRLERPRMRVDGRLQDTTWDACLDDLGTRLKDIIDRHGPESVAFYFSTMESAGFRMAEALHAAIGTPAKFSPLTIDGTAKPLVSDLVGGFMGLSGRTDLDNADFLMLVGVNPVVSHGHAISMPNPTGTVRDIARRGQVWVIDPRRTETARLATGHLAPRPSTDHAVLAYLVREILRDGMKTDVPVQGLDALAAAVEPFTLEHTAAFADVPEAELTRLCAAVRGADVRRDRNRDRRHDDRRARQRHPVARMGADDPHRRDEPTRRDVVPSRIRLSARDFRRVPAGDADRGVVRSRPAQPSGGAGVHQRMAVCRAARRDRGRQHPRADQRRRQPGHRFPETGKLIPALQQLEVFATTEIINNETTELATHVLPTKDPLERPDITIHDILSSRVSVQHTAAVVDPVGERRSMWWVFAELGRRLGYDLSTLGNPDSSTDDDVLAVLLAGARAQVRRGGGHGLGRGRSRSYPPRGSTTTSRGWAAGAWHRRCWSISWRRSSRPRHW